jgi:hypothetical protein
MKPETIGICVMIAVVAVVWYGMRLERQSRIANCIELEMNQFRKGDNYFKAQRKCNDDEDYLDALRDAS